CINPKKRISSFFTSENFRNTLFKFRIYQKNRNKLKMVNPKKIIPDNTPVTVLLINFVFFETYRESPDTRTRKRPKIFKLKSSKTQRKPKKCTPTIKHTQGAV